ncbi:MAG: ABC transporter permease [Anaerolineae bacterium]|jgi:ABC-type dipeptide/oligopeptide/nickel transport system permease subunit|nr:ABC transporter permease [Anaerolineae bacterium]
MSQVATLNAAPGSVPQPGSQNFWRELLRNLRRNRSARAGFAILGFLLLIAFAAPYIAPHDPLQSKIGLEPGRPARTPPCIPALGCTATTGTYVMGLDLNARDVFSRVLYGASISLTVGFTSVFFAIVVGMLLGLFAGYYGGTLDNLIMRVMDVLLAFPGLLLAIAFVTILEPRVVASPIVQMLPAVLDVRLFIVLLAIAIVFIPAYARVTRASVLSVKETEFVTAARALGAPPRRIIFRHILPHAMTPLIVQATLGIGTAILDAAALSFLGLGAQPPTPEWGAMLSEARGYVFTAPHLVFFPGLAIMLTVLGFNLLGDGLRDALDPRLNRGK